MQALLDRILRGFIVLGRLTVRWPDGQLTTYTGEPGPEALVEIRTAAAVRAILLNPALAAGETFMDGSLVPIDCTIYDLLNLFTTNMSSETSANPIMPGAGRTRASDAPDRAVQPGQHLAPQRRPSLRPQWPPLQSVS